MMMWYTTEIFFVVQIFEDLATHFPVVVAICELLINIAKIHYIEKSFVKGHL